MDKASDYESGDFWFESWRGRLFFLGEKTKILDHIIKVDIFKRKIDRSKDQTLIVKDKKVFFFSNFEELLLKKSKEHILFLFSVIKAYK